MGTYSEIQPQGYAVWWPPSGVLLSLLLLTERKKWVHVLVPSALASISANALFNMPVDLSITLVAANVAEGIFAAYCIRRFVGNEPLFNSPKSVLLVFLLGSILSNVLAGVLVALILVQINPKLIWGQCATTYFMTTGLGSAVFAPLLLSWIGPRNREPNATLSQVSKREQVAIYITAFSVSVIVFLQQPNAANPTCNPIWVVLPVMWSALRQGVRHTAVVAAISATICLLGSVSGYGPYCIPKSDAIDQITRAQLFAVILLIAGLVLASVLEQRDHALLDLARNEARYRALVSALPDTIFVQDLQGKYLDCQTTSPESLIAPPTEVVGRYMSELMPSEIVPRLQAALEDSIRTGQLQTLEYQSSKTQKFYEVRFTAISEDQVMSILRDVTDQTKAVIGVKQVNEALETKVRERTLELREAVDDLEAFAFSVSHDLRAPLRAIDGFARLLQTDYEHELSDDAKNYLNRIRKNSQRLSDLIRSVLEFSRLGRRPVHQKTVSLSKVACRALDDVFDGYPEHRVRVFIDPLPDVFADETLMRQVFVNLLSNAFKFSAGCPEPEVRVTSKVIDNLVEISVADNGIGFDPDRSQKLFGVFQRLHDPEQFEGTGIGLAFVQRIINRHGGSVWAESEVGKGATFTFSLPLDSLHAVVETRATVLSL